MGHKFFRILIVLCLLIGLAGGGGAVWVYAQFSRPGPSAADVTVIIERGQGLKSITRQLQTAGIIESALALEIGARFMGTGNDLQAGEFVIKAALSARDVLDVLRSGKTVLRRFTIAEGLTVSQVIEQIGTIEGMSGDLFFGHPPEGSLLPETYFFSYGADRQDIILQMRQGMTKLLSDLWSDRIDGLPLKTPHEALILASIVERETGVAEERSRVAGVFLNRLRRKMRLQSDPTVSYGVTNGEYVLGRPLSKADLKKPTVYNTYVIKALPPGPIANPGRAALEAVLLSPVLGKDLYFVADGSGGHAFAETLAGHNRNVRKWRKIQKAK
jgi:UPF0755 protein